MQNKTKKPEKTISLPNLPGIIITVILIVGIGAVYGLIGYLVLGIKENVTPVIQKPSLEITDNYFGNEFIQVKSPQKNATIKSSVLISGKANVYEANVRIRISDNNKNILADDFITADGWMDKLYSFEKEISYKTPQTKNGLIEIFEESAKDGSEIYKVEVPVVFEEYKDAFSDWKVYRNEKYGFEMKYPNNYIIEKNSEERINFWTEDRYKLNSEIMLSKGASGLSHDFQISIANEKWSKGIIDENLKNNEVQKEEIYSNNIKIIGFLKKSDEGDLYLNCIQKNNIYIIIYKNDNSTSEKEFDQILSTFKFTEEDETADWKVYRNEEFGFEMRYPEKWIIEDMSHDKYPTHSVCFISKEREKSKLFGERVCYCDIQIHLSSSLEYLPRNQYKLPLKEWLEQDGIQKFKGEETKISGVMGYVAETISCDSDLPEKNIFLEFEGKQYHIVQNFDNRFSVDENNQILSTFKFIEK